VIGPVHGRFTAELLEHLVMFEALEPIEVEQVDTRDAHRGPPDERELKPVSPGV